MTRARAVSELIREHRLAMGMSLGQLATHVGKTAALVRSWERGEEHPDPELLGRVADVLEFDLDEVAAMGADGSSTSDPDVRAPERAAGPEPEPEPEPEVVDAAVEPVVQPPADEPEPAAVPAAVPEEVTTPEPDDTAEDATGVEGRVVVPQMPAAPTYEAEVTVVTEPEALPGREVAAAREAPPAPASVLDAPTAAIPIEDMEREAKRVRASAQPLPAGSVVVPHYMDDPRERRRYWIRIGLTAVALFVLMVAVLWSGGHLSDAIGEVIDQFGSSVQ